MSKISKLKQKQSVFKIKPHFDKYHNIAMRKDDSCYLQHFQWIQIFDKFLIKTHNEFMKTFKKFSQITFHLRNSKLKVSLESRMFLINKIQLSSVNL